MGSVYKSSDWATCVHAMHMRAYAMHTLVRMRTPMRTPWSPSPLLRCSLFLSESHAGFGLSGGRGRVLLPGWVPRCHRTAWADSSHHDRPNHRHAPGLGWRHIAAAVAR